MLSVVIPCYNQNGHGPAMLTALFNSIRVQKIKWEYEIVISDTATNEEIKNVCDRFQLPIRYTRNEISFGASENINNAISLANYDKVKLMCQDDIFLLRNSLELFKNALDKSGWVISNSLHINAKSRPVFRKKARYDHNQFEKNITGMPSVIAWRKCDLRFDERLKTFCDMYFYYQLFELYGPPAIIKEFSIGQRFHDNSLSRTQEPSHDKDREFLKTNGLIKC